MTSHSGAAMPIDGSIGTSAAIQNLANKIANPTWASATGLNNSFVVNIGSYPDSQQIGGNLYTEYQPIVGAISVPANAAGTVGATIATGVTGYALTNTANVNAVGIIGYGTANADGTSAWGSNFIVTPTQIGGGTSNNVTLYGIEVDLGVHALSGGGQPNINGRAFYAQLDATIDTLNPNMAAFEADQAVAGGGHGWICAFQSDNFAAGIGLSLGYGDAGGSGNNHGSQTIIFKSITSGGTPHNAVIGTDANNTLNISTNTSITGTFKASSDVTLSTGMYAKGSLTSSNAANQTGIDFNSGARWLSWGPDTSTQGIFKVITIRSDGSSPVVVLDYGISTLGVWTFNQSVLMATSTSLSNGAGAQTATLTNGPVLGNPTKWVSINDNGTTRYIPAW